MQLNLCSGFTLVGFLFTQLPSLSVLPLSAGMCWCEKDYSSSLCDSRAASLVCSVSPCDEFINECSPREWSHSTDFPGILPGCDYASTSFTPCRVPEMDLSLVTISLFEFQIRKRAFLFSHPLGKWRTANSDCLCVSSGQASQVVGMRQAEPLKHCCKLYFSVIPLQIFC